MGVYKLEKGEKMKKIEEFLIEAKKQTYANGKARKTANTRLNSNDYDYQKENMIYHDTYFGGTNYGVTLDETLSEEAMDKALRPALMQVGSDDTIPVRGPREWINGEYKYTFEVEGDLSYFNGTETIYKNDKKISMS